MKRAEPLHRHHLRHAKQQAGMTLIEVVIALVLFALIALALVSAMSTMGETLTRSTQRIDQVNDMRIISQFLRQTLGSTQPFFLASPDGSNADFNGDSAHLNFVGNLTGHQGPGGLQFMRLYLEQGIKGDQKELVMQFTPWRPPKVGGGVNGVVPDFTNSKPQVLVSHVSEFSIKYLAPEGADDWQNQWTRLDRYPAAISLSIAVDGRYWPQMVIWIGAGKNGR